ncbi:hypothetical protein UlMin_022215 [Ulmus minor]
MNRLGAAILLHLVLVLFRVEAQSGSGPDFASQDDTNFQPSLGVVIGILSIMFVLTFFLLAYAKFCHSRESAVRNLANQTGVISTSSRFSGIDKTVIESLPFFRFSSLKGSKEGLECAVCLSKFEDVEVLRLLPKCKHAFHIACIDHWLERHSSCPLCRHRVSSEDLAIITYSTSMRFLWNNQSEQREDSNIELFVQREDSHRGSSRFSVGSSFRKIEKGDKDQELLLQQEGSGENDDQKAFHKHNHKIMVSDFVFKNRWSNVSSSDLIFLSSEMLNDMSSNRFSSLGTNVEHLACTKGEENEEITKIKAEMEIKRSFEIKVGTINSSVSAPSLPSSIPSSSKSINHGEQRSMSEITAISRNGNWGLKNKLKDSSLFENNAKEERLRRLWLPIARRTVQWFANREKRSSSQQSQNELERPLEQV